MRAHTLRLYRAFATRFGDGFGPVLAARSLQLLNGFATSVAVVWLFGLAAAGAYAVGLIGTGLLALFTGMGLPSSLPHSTALSEGRKASSGLMATFIAAPPAIAASLVFGWAVGRNAEEALAIAIFALSGHLFGQGNVLQTLLVMQRRARFAPLPHAVHGAGIAAAALLAHGLFEFGCILLAFRVAGNLAGFAMLRMERASARDVWTVVSGGRGFLSVDIVLVLSEELPPLLLSYLIPREAMGIFGICRQLLSAALTPGWSFVQSKYPDLVLQKLAPAHEVARRNMQIALSAAAAAFAGSAFLALLIYRLPVLIPAMAVLLLTLPAGYATYHYELFIRAAGDVQASNELAAAKAVVAVGLFWLLGSAFGLWGGLTAAAIVPVLAALAYRFRFQSIRARAAGTPQLPEQRPTAPGLTGGAGKL